MRLSALRTLPGGLLARPSRTLSRDGAVLCDFFAAVEVLEAAVDGRSLDFAADVLLLGAFFFVGDGVGGFFVAGLALAGLVAALLDGLALAGLQSSAVILVSVVCTLGGPLLSIGSGLMKLGLGRGGRSAELDGRSPSLETMLCLLAGRLKGNSRRGGILASKSSSS